jgi:hypothetical protein
MSGQFEFFIGFLKQQPDVTLQLCELYFACPEYVRPSQFGSLATLHVPLDVGDIPCVAVFARSKRTNTSNNVHAYMERMNRGEYVLSHPWIHPISRVHVN